MTRYQKYAETFFYTEATLGNVTIHTNTNSSEVGHIADRLTVLYCDVNFSKSSARLHERLKLALILCARYIYGIFRSEHISTYTSRILSVLLDVYYSLQIFKHTICVIELKFQTPKLTKFCNQLKVQTPKVEGSVLVPEI
jgi:hypothetical protein